MQTFNIFNTGINPAGIAITPNGKYAYVANNNNYGINGSDNVTVLDLIKGVPKTTINDNSFNEPYRIAIDHHGRYAYVCNSGSTTISIINIELNQVVNVIDEFNGPSGIVLSKTSGYVINYGAGAESGNGNTLSVIDLNRKIIVNTIQVDQAPASLVINRDATLLYVVCYVDGNHNTGVLDVIDINTNAIINRIPGLFGPFGVVLSKDELYAYVTNFGSNNFSPFGTSVAVIDLMRNNIVRTIETGIQPAAIAISSCGKYIYVSNYNTLYAGSNFQNLTAGEGTISVIRTRDNTVKSTISVGQSPSGLCISPDGKQLYVSKYIQNTVTAISLNFQDESHKRCK